MVSFELVSLAESMAMPGGPRMANSGSTVVLACGVRTPTKPRFAYSKSAILGLSTMDRILIVGGGPVGLFAAIRLTGFGIPVTLVEKGRAVSDDLRSSTIHPPTLE